MTVSRRLGLAWLGKFSGGPSKGDAALACNKLGARWLGIVGLVWTLNAGGCTKTVLSGSSPADTGGIESSICARPFLSPTCSTVAWL